MSGIEGRWSPEDLNSTPEQVAAVRRVIADQPDAAKLAEILGVAA